MSQLPENSGAAPQTTAARPERRGRGKRPQTVLHVLGREELSPTLVRLHLGGPGFDSFPALQHTDSYVKIHFVKPELGLEPPYDMAELRETLAPEDLPVTRTYTVREVDRARKRISIDFVVHGEQGLAGPWAARAQPGEQVVLTGPGGGYRPDPEADWYLFAGDESALPAIAAGIEALPAEARGIAFIEVYGSADELAIQAPAGLEIRWLHRAEAPAGTSQILAESVRDMEWQQGRVQAFVHGERESMKAMRDLLFTQRGLERSQVSLSGYWAYGRAEDRFQAEKREPIGQILAPEK